MATAFAVGVFIGMSPLLGLHTVLGLLGCLAIQTEPGNYPRWSVCNKSLDYCAYLFLWHMDWGKNHRNA